VRAFPPHRSPAIRQQRGLRIGGPSPRRRASGKRNWPRARGARMAASKTETIAGRKVSGYKEGLSFVRTRPGGGVGTPTNGRERIEKEPREPARRVRESRWRWRRRRRRRRRRDQEADKWPAKGPGAAGRGAAWDGWLWGWWVCGGGRSGDGGIMRGGGVQRAQIGSRTRLPRTPLVLAGRVRACGYAINGPFTRIVLIFLASDLPF
jgi:hypothetical protein